MNRIISLLTLGAKQKSSVIAQLNVDQQPITIVATHPFPPLKPSFFQLRNQQLNFISQYLAGVDHRIILAGDLNMTMWSPYYRRLINKTGLSNTRKGFGILPSWSNPSTSRQIPTWLTSFLAIPIDHCLINEGLKATNVYTGANIGSDHLPLIVDLQITTPD